MIVIGDVIVSDDVVDKQFLCDLSKCKGACCVEGDGGAPLEVDEMKLIDDHFDAIHPYLSEKGRAAIVEKGRYVFEKDDEYTGYGTPLIGHTGACAYVVHSEDGTAKCGIEAAWEDGKLPFQKPVSCHLYPVRVKVYEEITAVNYEVWDICSEACILGKEMKMPAFEFVKAGLIRRFGQEFYDQLKFISDHRSKEKAQPL